MTAIAEAIPYDDQGVNPLWTVGELGYDIENWDVLAVREEGVLAMVPLDDISEDELTIDDDNLEYLDKLHKEEQRITGGTGQRDPIVIAIVPELEDAVQIANGYHRRRLQKRNKADKIYSVILLDRTPDQLNDLHVYYTEGHDKVQYARISPLLKKAWSSAPWKEHFSIITAFKLAQSSNPRDKHGLDEQGLVELRQWVANKAEAWGLSIPKLLENLSVTESLHPYIVPCIRQGKNALSAKTISVGHAEAIFEFFPDDLDFQLLLAQTVMDKQLNTNATRVFADRLYAARSLDEAEDIVGSTDFNQPELRTAAERRKLVEKHVIKESDVDPVIVINELYGMIDTIQALARNRNQDKAKFNEVTKAKGQIVGRALLNLFGDGEIAVGRISPFQEAKLASIDKQKPLHELMEKDILDFISRLTIPVMNDRAETYRRGKIYENLREQLANPPEICDEDRQSLQKIYELYDIGSDIKRHLITMSAKAKIKPVTVLAVLLDALRYSPK